MFTLPLGVPHAELQNQTQHTPYREPLLSSEGASSVSISPDIPDSSACPPVLATPLQEAWGIYSPHFTGEQTEARSQSEAGLDLCLLVLVAFPPGHPKVLSLVTSSWAEGGDSPRKQQKREERPERGELRRACVWEGRGGRERGRKTL